MLWPRRASSARMVLAPGSGCSSPGSSQRPSAARRPPGGRCPAPGRSKGAVLLAQHLLGDAQELLLQRAAGRLPSQIHQVADGSLWDRSGCRTNFRRTMASAMLRFISACVISLTSHRCCFASMIKAAAGGAYGHFRLFVAKGNSRAALCKNDTPAPFCPVTEKPRRFTLSTSHRRSAPAAPQDQCKSRGFTL